MNTGKSIIRNLPITLFLVLNIGCAPATESPQTKVEVVDIIESNLVAGEITQIKVFNHCDAASPFKMAIQFSDSASETNQDELVLGASVTGGADVSGVAKVEIQGSVEKHFSSIKTNDQSHSENINIEVPAYTRQEYTIIWKETRREGIVEYIENGEAKSTSYSYRVGLEFASSSVRNIDCSLPTETPFPVAPTPSLVSEVSATLPAGTLADGCINPQHWTPTDGVSTISNNCYSIESLGIFTDQQGVLHLYRRDKRSAETSGIYTSINTNYSVVEFSIYVNSMYIANSESPAYITFAVAPANAPTLAKDSARFKLYVEKPGKDPAILFMMADVGENNGVKIMTQHYEYSRTYHIRLELVGGLMRVYINNLKMDESLSIPDGVKAFYIGYTLPALAGMDVEVSNIQIDGVPK